MKMNFDRLEQALQAPTMEAVIALSERVQTLEAHPEGMIFTLFRDIDNILLLGYTDQFNHCLKDYERRGFRAIGHRRGTRREQRLLLLTLQDTGLNSSYGPNYFDADSITVRHLGQLGWPIGDLSRQFNLTQSPMDPASFKNESLEPG